MAIQGSVRLDKLQGLKTGGGLISFKAPVDFQNGQVFNAEDLVSGERELFTATQPATASLATKPVYINISVETVYQAGQTVLDYFTPSGTPGRGIRPAKGDLITISDNVITGSTVVGQYVGPVNASYQLSASASAPTSLFVGKVIEKTTIYGQAASVIEVLAN